MSKVLVIGGANMDIKAKTLAAHVLATSNPADIIVKPGGVARNIAHNLARLGVETTLVTVLGQDANAETILAATANAGVNTCHIMCANASTGIYLALLNASGELITAASDMTILEFLSREHVVNSKSLVKENILIVADCNLSDDALDELASQAGDRLIIEPVSVAKSQKLIKLLGAHKIFLATPNLDQVEALTGSRVPHIAAKILHGLGLENVVIHAGEKGAFVSNGETLTHIPSVASTIVDVTGAGDAATAGLILGLTRNLTLEKAASLGQEIAERVLASHASTLD